MRGRFNLYSLLIGAARLIRRAHTVIFKRRAYFGVALPGNVVYYTHSSGLSDGTCRGPNSIIVRGSIRHI